QAAKGSKVLMLCNPNNPTGKLLDKSFLLNIVQQFNGLVVVDEAYIDFCPEKSLANEVGNYSNLIVTQTLSKAFGMAGLRVGMAWANTQWITALNSIKPPYNISSLVQESAIDTFKTNDWTEIIKTIKSERVRIQNFLENLENVETVIPSEANFILFRMKNARTVYQSLIEEGIIVRNRSTQFNCENTLRVSIGSPAENDRFIQKMKTL
ncbi:MAG: aminotransferase class I/II-fold pyridoxal phosphate-dependent enzyme, partial [Fluviicola sp.]|nr:aminotransferase class I/II-fold pyridoxal phosphate-dependent enzyme [Fluviicola sp.]